METNTAAATLYMAVYCDAHCSASFEVVAASFAEADEIIEWNDGQNVLGIVPGSADEGEAELTAAGWERDHATDFGGGGWTLHRKARA